MLKLDDERMDVLFAGKPVVVKKATDEKTAARYQQVFQKAGARLRVLPVGDTAKPDAQPVSHPTPPHEESNQASTTSASASPASAERGGVAESGGELQALPVGSDMLSDKERTTVESQDIDTEHLSVQGAVFVTDEPQAQIDGPNVDHITLAELGALLGTPQEEIEIQEIDVSFDLAEVGALLREADEAIQAAPVLANVDFEIAEVGVDMDTQEKAATSACTRYESYRAGRRQ